MRYLLKNLWLVAFILLVVFLHYFRFKLPFLGPYVVKRYYELGTYEKEVEELCKKAIDYFSTIPVKKDSLVIFDVDDTAVYNIRFRKKTTLKTPLQTAIIPVLNLYNYLIARGFTIIFLTSRDFCEETKKELIEAGYSSFTELICMPPHLSDDYTATWKAAIRKRLAKQYTIVASIADRNRDFFDGYNGYKIKLPNYLYN